MKILVVDGDPFILGQVSAIAAGIGFPEVVTALSEDAALVAIAGADRPFECLLLDIGLSGRQSLELWARIRAIPDYREVPIIMLAATEGRAVIDRAFRAGATDCVAKPLDREDLSDRLQAAQAARIAQSKAEGAAGPRQSLPDWGGFFDLSEEILLDDVDNLVDYAALKSHLVQLSPAGLGGVQVVAVKIDRIEAIHARASPHEFLYALAETADAIGEVFKPFGHLMAYAGRGIFIVISVKASLEPSVLVEGEIQSLLDEKNPEYDNGDPLDIDVSVGNPIRPTISRMRRIVRTFERAIARAESRSLRKHAEPRRLSIRIFG